MSLKKAFCIVQLYGIYREQQARSCTCPRPCCCWVFFVIGSLNMLDFTVSQVHSLLCYQLHRIMVLCVLVYVAERHALGSAHYS